MLNVTDNLSLQTVMKAKNTVNVKLLDAETGMVMLEFEKDNMILNEANDFAEAMMKYYIATNFAVKPLNNRFGSIIEYFPFMVMYLNNDSADVLPDEAPYTKNMLAFATMNATYSGGSVVRGTLNTIESYYDVENNKIVLVVDFPTNVANGTFQSVGFWNLSPSLTYGIPLADGGSAVYQFANVVPSGVGKLKNKKVSDAIPNMSSEFSFNPFSDEQPDGTSFYLSGANFGKVNLLSGAYTALPQLKTNLGANGLFYFPMVIGGWLYACTSSAGSVNWMKWDLANLTSNGSIVTLPFVSYGLFAGLGGNFYMLGASTANDPVLGVAQNRIVYELDFLFGVVNRIDIGNPLGTYPASYRTCLRIRIYSDKLYLYFGGYTFKNSSNAYNSIFAVVVDLTSDSYEGMFVVAYFSYPNTANINSTPVFFDLEGDICNVIPVAIYKTGAFYQVLAGNNKLGGGVVSRVVLPAPVTKLNTQVVKVTYSLGL